MLNRLMLGATAAVDINHLLLRVLLRGHLLRMGLEVLNFLLRIAMLGLQVIEVCAEGIQL
jgi:hypothetical protein